MEKIPTAEEVIAKIVKFESTNDIIECTVYSLSQVMIEFAKRHVTDALKEASEKALVYADEGGYSEFVDEYSILNSYSLDNIK